MSQFEALPQKALLINALQWFQPAFHQALVSPIEGQFPNHPLPSQIQAILQGAEEILRHIQAWPDGPISAAEFADKLKATDDRHPLFKQIVFLYRRWRAAYAESLTEKTFHLEAHSNLSCNIDVGLKNLRGSSIAEAFAGAVVQEVLGGL